MYPRAVDLGARMRGIEGETRHRQSAAARQRLIDRGGKITVEGIRRQQAGPDIEQAVGLDRLQGSGQLRLERRVTDQRQGVGADICGFAADDFEIWQLIGRRQRIRRQHHGQMAEAGILGQHGEEGIHHARTKTFAEHDAVDVAGVEMLGGGLDRQRADHAHPLAERHRQRRVGGATADQQYGRVAGRIEIGQARPPGRRRAGASRWRAGRGPAGWRADAPAGDRSCPRFAKTEWRCREAGLRSRPRSAADRAAVRQSVLPAHEMPGSAGSGIATRTAAGAICSTARDASAQPVSMTGNNFASSSAPANGGRPAVETTMIGPCWDIWNSDRRGGISAQA